MLITTTATVEGKEIIEYKGVVFGETIMGANIFRDFMAAITDVIGGRSGSYENKLQEGRETALREMIERAHRMGANAIVGMDVDYEVIGKEGSMLMVAVSGTAVVIR